MSAPKVYTGVTPWWFNVFMVGVMRKVRNLIRGSSLQDARHE